MATNQNLFEKYGIKDVANVTFYRIDKKKETYLSFRIKQERLNIFCDKPPLKWFEAKLFGHVNLLKIIITR